MVLFLILKSAVFLPSLSWVVMQYCMCPGPSTHNHIFHCEKKQTRETTSTIKFHERSVLVFFLSCKWTHKNKSRVCVLLQYFLFKNTPPPSLFVIQESGLQQPGDPAQRSVQRSWGLDQNVSLTLNVISSGNKIVSAHLCAWCTRLFSCLKWKRNKVQSDFCYFFFLFFLWLLFTQMSLCFSKS